MGEDYNNIFPCRECLGKSDNYINDLSFKNNILTYTTSIAPIASNNYSVINFKLKFSNNKFTIFNYSEEVFAVGNDDSAKINLDNKNFNNNPFNYYEWTSDKSWLTNVNLSNTNITTINDFVYNLQNINPSISSEVLDRIISQFPERTVAYLNLGDSYWNMGEKEKAIENYKKYISLMKSQNKDLRKIPKQVLEKTR